MKWIELVQDGVHYLAFLNMVMDIHVPLRHRICDQLNDSIVIVPGRPPAVVLLRNVLNRVAERKICLKQSC
jgi:hypothetical protein